jgi:predicted Zn finger-like uncharacterized protein
MLIVCPNCSRNYLVRASELGPKDRLVRCGACQTSWRPDEAIAENQTDSTVFGTEITQETATRQPLSAQAEAPMNRKRKIMRPLWLGATAAIFAGLAALTVNGQTTGFLSRAIGWIDAMIPGNGLQGLSFANLKTSIKTENGETALTIEGEIRSDSMTEKNLPELRFTMRDEAQNTIFQWMIPAPAPTIAKGEAVPFKARLASPPRDAKNIVIAFSGA